MRFLKYVLRTVEVIFIVFSVFIASLFFMEQRLPGEWVEKAVSLYAPSNLVVHVDSFGFGLRHGLRVRGLKIYDTSSTRAMELLAGADSISVYPLLHRIVVVGAKYTRLPDGYYAPGNLERNARVEAVFPDLGTYSFEFERPDILGVRAECVTGTIAITPHRLAATDIHLDWPDQDERMSVDGECFVDLEHQRLTGSVEGLAKQANLRDMMLVLDIPSAMPYYDGFTEVPGPVPAGCSWDVNLINNDFDMTLRLRPNMGKYNGVRMKAAEGIIKLHVYTRGTHLNYHQTIGPIHGTGLAGQPLDGTVIVDGTNGYNTVTVDAASTLPVADILRIGGFVGDYVGENVCGKSRCQLEFRFPRAMTNNYELMNGRGSIEVRDGQIMRMRGFRGLIEAMPSIAPAVSWFSDSTRASGSYVIENGILKSDDIRIEGSCFTIRMFGSFDTVAEKLDFTVWVQFLNEGSMIGKIVETLTSPFSRLLLEFKLKGSPSKPVWTYNSVIHRVIEVTK